LATHIFDIDGTVFEYHTNEWIDGARDKILELSRKGDTLIFITMRGGQDKGKEWSIERTQETLVAELKSLGVEFNIIFNVQSPRTLHDDGVIYLDRRRTNEVW